MIRNLSSILRGGGVGDDKVLPQRPPGAGGTGLEVLLHPLTVSSHWLLADEAGPFLYGVGGFSHWLSSYVGSERCELGTGGTVSGT